MSRAELHDLRMKQIEGWKASGLTQRAYCERESISLKTFCRWRRRLREQRSVPPERPTRLVAVRVAGAAEATGDIGRSAGISDSLSRPVEVVLSSGRRLRFVSGLDETGLARLVRLLEVLPC
jgi:hypothetical protein